MRVLIRIAVLTLSWSANTAVSQETRYDPSPTDPRIIAAQEAVRRRNDAINSANFEEARKWISPGFIVNGPINKVVGREDVLTRMAKGEISYDRDRGEGHWEFIGIRGDLVIFMGYRIVEPNRRAPLGGKRLTQRVTEVWREQDGRWQAILRQATISAVEDSSQ